MGKSPQSPQGCYKLNTNGLANGNHGPATYSAIVGDSNGKWVVACNRELGHTTNFVAKLRDLRDGLLFIKSRGLLHIMTEVDFLSVINTLINLHKPNPTSAFSLIENCKYLLQLLGNLTIRHVYREANVVTEFIAKIAM